jgi:DnaJ domain
VLVVVGCCGGSLVHGAGENAENMRTHYQNLKVAEDAPPEVIKAAWRALSQQYHPDKNPGDARAVRVMQIINEAYAVLSDPSGRAQHDAVIRKHRSSANQENSEPPPLPKQHAAPPERSWFVQMASSKIEGPYNLAKLATMQRAGMINMQTNVCEHGADEVITLRELLRRLNKLPGNQQVSIWQNLGRLISSYPRLSLIVIIYLIAFFIGWVGDKTNVKSSNYSSPYTSTPAPASQATTYSPYTPAVPSPSYYAPPVARQPAKPRYLRPLTAPNGQQWPIYSGYISGYPVLYETSYCEVTIDNTLCSGDVHAKIVQLPNLTLRNCFIKGGDSFKMGKLPPGNYEIRYRDLDTGKTTKSETFDLQVINTGDGVSYSTISLTLYMVKNGNTHMQAISEEEF